MVVPVLSETGTTTVRLVCKLEKGLRANVAAKNRVAKNRVQTRADGRDRTGDIRFTRAVLYQLSYVGVIPDGSARFGSARISRSSGVALCQKQRA
jgi:hypothetical protein